MTTHVGKQFQVIMTDGTLLSGVVDSDQQVMRMLKNAVRTKAQRVMIGDVVVHVDGVTLAAG